MDVTLNWALVEVLRGLCFGTGFSVALYLIGVPFRRWTA